MSAPDPASEGVEPLAGLPGSRHQVHLLGFMGCGKSTVGRLLARRLVWNFLDLDAMIQRHVGAPVAEIFATEGESGFRHHERFVLRQISLKPRTVVALGGGTPGSAANRAVSTRVAVTVWLRCPFAELRARVAAHGGPRPVWGSDGHARELLRRREADYARADMVVDAAGDAAGVAESIERRLRPTTGGG